MAQNKKKSDFLLPKFQFNFYTKMEESSSESSNESSSSESSEESENERQRERETRRIKREFKSLTEKLESAALVIDKNLQKQFNLLEAKFEKKFQDTLSNFEIIKNRELNQLRRQKEKLDEELTSVAKLRQELEEQKKTAKASLDFTQKKIKSEGDDSKGNKSKKKSKKSKKKRTQSTSEDSSSSSAKSSEEEKPKRNTKEEHASDNYATADEIEEIEIINGFLPPEVNIVLLGGTGIGKSTFINAIANMLSHRNLDEAKMDVHVLIKTAFHFIELDTHIDHKITMEPTIAIEKQGESENENTKVGESCTKLPKSYAFKYGRPGFETTIRIIDTPGVGDTNGVEQDRENFRHIINFVSSFREIHAFLFVLKPNYACLELQFHYCIKELLTHLHISATENIIFCITNGKDTNYKPGETFGTLQALLNTIKKERNIEIQLHERCLVFDNEFYRYLCEVQHDMKHTKMEIKNYHEGWTRGKNELSKMMKIIANLTPHDVNNTLSVNKVRRVIEIMSKPLAELAKNLLINIRLIEDKQAEVRLLQYLPNSIQIQECLNKGKYLKDLKVTDLEVQRSIVANNDRVTVANLFLAHKRREIHALKKNLDRKQTICAHFAIFLKDNSVLAYNDQCMAYMNSLIQEERERVQCGSSKETLYRLETCQFQYIELKKVFDNPTNGRKMTLIEIEDLIKEIKKMDDEDIIKDIYNLEIIYPAHLALDSPPISIKQTKIPLFKPSGNRIKQIFGSSKSQPKKGKSTNC